MKFYYVGYVSDLASAVEPMTGLRRSCTVVHSGYCIGDVCLSAEWQLLLGVPQGSVLGAILFLLYTAELFDVIAECGLTGHKYGDDMQVYTPATDHIDAMDWLAACIERIRDWMADNHLKLNEEKTQIIRLGTRQQLNKVTAQALTLPNDTVEFSTTVKDLAIVRVHRVLEKSLKVLEFWKKIQGP